MTPEELTPALAEQALQGAALLYFDGRLTEAALVLAAAARARGVPVLVEAERLRPGARWVGCGVWRQWQDGQETLQPGLATMVEHRLTHLPLHLLQAWSSCWGMPTMWSAPRTFRRAGQGRGVWAMPCWQR